MEISKLYDWEKTFKKTFRNILKLSVNSRALFTVFFPHLTIVSNRVMRDVCSGNLQRLFAKFCWLPFYCLQFLSDVANPLSSMIGIAKELLLLHQ